ncbi:protein of unknown function [Tepidibacter aestuarii]|nr:protein of unknown function [Tepidibacter aestuarii]
MLTIVASVVLPSMLSTKRKFYNSLVYKKVIILKIIVVDFFEIRNGNYTYYIIQIRI